MRAMQASTEAFLNKWFTNFLKFCVKGSPNILKISILKNPKKKKNLKKVAATCRRLWAVVMFGL
jgi:hypothetical protein